jgi:hypothetical protein
MNRPDADAKRLFPERGKAKHIRFERVTRPGSCLTADASAISMPRDFNEQRQDAE